MNFLKLFPFGIDFSFGHFPLEEECVTVPSRNLYPVGDKLHLRGRDYKVIIDLLYI